MTAPQTPHQCFAPYCWAALLHLIQAEFAYMQGRVDPPSSMHRLTADTIAAQARSAEVWAIGSPPIACVFLTPKPDALYIGKLAVAAPHRRRGLARALLTLAETRAHALNLPALELQTRVELIENQTTFTDLGFAEVTRTAHPGHTRPASITYRRSLA